MDMNSCFAGTIIIPNHSMFATKNNKNKVRKVKKTTFDNSIIQSIRNIEAGAIYIQSEIIKQSTGTYPTWEWLSERIKMNDLEKHAAVRELKRLNLLPHLHNKGL